MPNGGGEGGVSGVFYNFSYSLTQHGCAVRVRFVVIMFILSRPRKNEPRKRTKGPKVPWNPAARKGRGAVALLIFSRSDAASAFAFAS